jgi:hypothetical protein
MEIFNGTPKHKGMWRHGANVAFEVHKRTWGKILWVNNGGENIGENLKVVRDTHVITIGAESI